MKSKGGVVEDMESSESSLDKGSCARAIHPGHQGVGIQPKEAWMTTDLFRTTKNRLHFAHFNVVCLRLSSFLHSQCFFDALCIGKTWWSLMWSKTWKQKPMQWDGVPSIYPPPHSRNWLHGVERHCRLRPRKAWPRGSHIICIKMYKYHNVVIKDIQNQIILYYLINRHNIYSNCPSIRSIRSISKKLGHAFVFLRIKQLTAGDRCSCIPAPNDFTRRQVVQGMAGESVETRLKPNHNSCV